jgi:lipoxygenase homology domain-containing protein 1
MLYESQLAAGSRENVIDLFDVKNRDSPYHHRKRMIGHSSAVNNLDWSADSKLIQSTCGAYEILYWDAIKGKNLRATKDSTESDTVSSSVERKIERGGGGRESKEKTIVCVDSMK